MIRELKRDIVALVAYLIGVKKDLLVSNYSNCGIDFEKLDDIKEMRIIRDLSILRMNLFLNNPNVDNQLHSGKTISEIDVFSEIDISQLEQWGIRFSLCNVRANDHMKDFNKTISERIDDCKIFFPSWIEWAYIRNLFIMPNGNDEYAIKAEFSKYITNKKYYPFTRYINWIPNDYSNPLHNDIKFLRLIYEQNGNDYDENNKVIDMSEGLTEDICYFLNDSETTIILVNCQIFDAHDFYGLINGLTPKVLNKIQKIVLYNISITSTWRRLEKVIDINIEFIKVERIEHMDISMTVQVCSEFYNNNIKSFILLSNDFEFGGLISSIPKAKFLVIVENEKTYEYLAMPVNNEYLTEGSLMITDENKFFTGSIKGLEDCITSGRIVEAICIKCDYEHNLIIDFGFIKGIIPRNEGAVGIDTEMTRDIALITRVNKPVCFIVTGFTDGMVVLSRKQAQLECIANYTDHLKIGDIIPAKITHLEHFGCYADIGCGIDTLIPISDTSVSRIPHTSDRFYVGQRILAAVKTKESWGVEFSTIENPKNRTYSIGTFALPKITLTHKELLGTWEQNASCFRAGETVIGIVRSIEDYGVFVELLPNFAGLAELADNVRVNQTVSVYIKAIIPEKTKVKLIIVNSFETSPINYNYDYFIDSGRISSWIHSAKTADKMIRTDFV